MSAAGEDLYWVGGIASAVPQQQPAGRVASGRVKLFSQDAATDLQSVDGIAKRGKKRLAVTVLSRDLSHYLHQSPTEAAGVSFRSADLIIGEKWCDVSCEEHRLVTNRPGIPG